IGPMILLDTHIWIGWAHGTPTLPPDYQNFIQQEEANGLGVSAISCWEIARLVKVGRLKPPSALEIWIPQLLAYPGITLLALSPAIAIEANRLPGAFHKD